MAATASLTRGGLGSGGRGGLGLGGFGPGGGGPGGIGLCGLACKITKGLACRTQVALSGCAVVLIANPVATITVRTIRRRIRRFTVPLSIWRCLGGPKRNDDGWTER
jgi:hypothetical protein